MNKQQDMDELHWMLLSDPLCWDEKADDLGQIAALILPKVMEYWSPETKSHDYEHFVAAYLMISSYQIENLLKGIFVAENRTRVKEELKQRHRLPRLLTTHNLKRLLVILGFRDTDAYSDILHRLSRAAEWHARYPAPLRPHDMPAGWTMTHDGKEYFSWSLNSSSDVAEIQHIVAVLKQRLDRGIEIV